jgi:hypothetical protein
VSKLIAAVALSLFIQCLSGSAFAQEGPTVFKEPGIYVSRPNGSCTAALKTSEKGGFMQLFIGHDGDHLAHVADDVNAVAWASAESLVYSVSPIYGKPGVFVVTCSSTPKVSILVAPTHKDRAYPDGSDYFEVQAVRGHEVRYRYGADVDRIDFEHWHSAENVQTAHLTAE